MPPLVDSGVHVVGSPVVPVGSDAFSMLLIIVLAIAAIMSASCRHLKPSRPRQHRDRHRPAAGTRLVVAVVLGAAVTRDVRAEIGERARRQVVAGNLRRAGAVRGRPRLATVALNVKQCGIPFSI